MLYSNFLYLQKQFNSNYYMKKILAYFILILLLNIQSFAQINVKIIVISNNVSESEKIFITGNKPELGNWNPGIISMEKENDSTWSKEFYFSKGAGIELKITKGTWNNEALNDDGGIPGNTNLTVFRDTIIYFNINNWADFRKQISGQITGDIRYHKNFMGKDILTRDIIVWLPPGYNSLTNKYYPVLYMQDGQNIFDPLTSSFGIDWQIDETSDSLIKTKSIDEIIIVGIYNTSRRVSEYKNNDTGYRYINFIINMLKPFIDSTYRTLPDKNNTAIGGSSLGGLISFIAAWEHPDIFSKAACLSPAFKISDIDFVKTVKDYTGLKKPIKFYIDNGDIGLEKRLQPGVDEMLSVLRDKGYVDGKDIYYFQDFNADHNEATWAKRVYKFLKYFFPYSN